MRVLHLTAGKMFGGVERMLITLARQQSVDPSTQHEFAVCFEGKFHELASLAGATTYALRPARLSRPWTVWRVRSDLRKILVRQRFDVVGRHGTWVFVVLGPVGRSGGLPTACYVHDVPDAKQWLDRGAARGKPSMVIANSDFTKVAATALFSGVPVHRHYPFVELSPRVLLIGERNALRRSLQCGSDDVVILIATRFVGLKGHEFLMRALGQLRVKPGWQCLIAGSAQNAEEVEYESELQRIIMAQGIDSRVKFVGFRDDVADLMAAADIYCQPNVKPESFGLAFVEAMSAGLAVVTSDLGAAREVIGENAGRLVANGNVEELANTLRELIEGPSTRHALSVAAVDRSRAFADLPAQVREFNQLLLTMKQPRGSNAL